MRKHSKSLLLASMAAFGAEGNAALSSMYGGNGHAPESNYTGSPVIMQAAAQKEFVAGPTREQLGIGTLNPGARIIGINVANSSSTLSREVVLFGSYSANTAAENITITSDTVLYNQLMEEIKSNPMLFEGLKITAGGTSPTAQLADVMKLSTVESTGREITDPYNPGVFLSPLQNVANIIEDPNFRFVASGANSLKFTLRPGTSLKLQFFLKAIADVSRVVTGQNALAVTNASAPIGTQRAALGQA